MNKDERQAYAKNRVESAYESFKAAKLLAENGFWNASVNRLYYSCYYIVNALLILNGIEAKSHSGTKAQFALHFVKSGVLDKKYGKLLAKLFDWKQQGDYENIMVFNEEMVLALFDPLDEMLERIKTEIQKDSTE